MRLDQNEQQKNYYEEQLDRLRKEKEAMEQNKQKRINHYQSQVVYLQQKLNERARDTIIQEALMQTQHQRISNKVDQFNRDQQAIGDMLQQIRGQKNKEGLFHRALLTESLAGQLASRDKNNKEELAEFVAQQNMQMQKICLLVYNVLKNGVQGQVKRLLQEGGQKDKVLEYLQQLKTFNQEVLLARESSAGGQLEKASRGLVGLLQQTARFEGREWMRGG